MNQATTILTCSAFPLSAKREAGYQLDRVQNGQEPNDWKPMNTVGQGVKEIRIRDAAGAFRVIYVAKFADARLRASLFQEEDREMESGLFSGKIALTRDVVDYIDKP